MVSSHTNVTVESDNHMECLYLEIDKLKTELKHYRDKTESLQRELKNIPQAISDHGYVDFYDRYHNKILRAVADKTEKKND